MWKLALKNLKSKPVRAAATALAIAIAVAMIFAMLSFSPAVYDFIYASQTATSGRSDIVISTNSTSDRIINNVASPLQSVDGVKDVCPSLTLYALLDGEYVQARGFEQGRVQDLQDIEAISGSLKDVGVNDNVAISQAAAKHFGLEVGDRAELSLNDNRVSFTVCAIAKASGYFLADSPYLFLGRINRISKLILPMESPICNEIYVKAEAGADIDALVAKIQSMPDYSSMLVRRTDDEGYIKEQADSLSAPVVLSGAAVLALGIAVIVLLFMMSEGEKLSLISKYGVIGATKKQIAGIFLIEGVTLAGIGALVGSALAVGVFVAILKFTLSSSLVFGISAWRLFAAAVIGFATAVFSSAVPILRSFKGTIRQNQIDVRQKSKLSKIVCPIMLVLAAVSVAIEFAVPSLTAVFGVISLALSLAALGVCIATVLRGSAKAVGKSSSPTVKVASVNIVRDRRFSRAVTMLGVGMTVSMMLFMAWSLTKSVFSDYVSDFDKMIFVTNVRADVDPDGFKEVDGVKSAVKMVWKQGELSGAKFDKTMNLLGSREALGLVDFEYVTQKETVKELLAGDGHYVFLDIALKELYGVKTGDILSFALDDKVAEVTVGGILKHRLFSGNYVVMSDSVISELYGIAPDTVVVTAQSDTAAVADGLRAKFADNNYYAVDVLTAYKWDMQSTDAVFDLIGTLAVVVGVFIFAITVAASLVGRNTSEKARTALLNAGMSKSSLFKAEIIEHCMIAAVSFVLSFAVSVLLTACLIHALRLFGLYFEFMYKAWVVAVVGLAMSAAYVLVPIAFNFKKGYNIKKR